MAEAVTPPGLVDMGIEPDADDALVRRMIEAAELPELLDRETVATLLEASQGTTAILFVNTPSGIRIVEALGCSPDEARRLAADAIDGSLSRRPNAAQRAAKARKWP